MSNTCALDSDDEDVSFEPRNNRIHLAEKIDVLNDEITGLKGMVSDVMKLTKDTKIPFGLKKVVGDSFKCKICHLAPIKPPVIMSKCCKTLLGCDSCVNRWFSGDDALTKVCPFCKSERGYNETMQLKGLDDFMIKMKEVVNPFHANVTYMCPTDTYPHFDS